MRVAECFRPIRAWAPRGYGFLYKRLLGEYYGSFRSDPEVKQRLEQRNRVIRDRYLGAYVCVDLGDWAGREHYFKGIYYDRTVPLLVDRIFSGGRGTFIDVGANRGMHTLYAARSLQRGGRVYSFEPNPETFEVLKAHLVMNRIRNCVPVQAGLADSRAELSLNLFADDHSGTCSFVPSAEVARTVKVPVLALDETLDPDSLEGPVFVKIDVEGFEHRAAKGMPRLLGRPDVTVLCEVTDEWLRAAGSSAEGLVGYMRSLGYELQFPEIRYDYWVRERLEMTALGSAPQLQQFDAVFTRKR
jgi:FkbM family methyltransferase